MEAARHWVTGAGGNSNAEETEAIKAWKADLKEMDYTDEQIAQAFAQRDRAIAAPALAEPCMVWPENEPALMAFLNLRTQWHLHPQTGLATALRYGPARCEARSVHWQFAGTQTEAIFRDLQVMERAALIAIHERAASHE